MKRLVKLSSEQLAVALMFAVLFVLASRVKAQSDTWWQLRSGEEIWHSRAVSFVDTYSHTARGEYWPNHEWLTEVLFYGMHQTGGMPLLAAFCASALVLAYALSWRLMSGPFEVRFALFALALTSGVGAWSMRPQVVSMVCFMITCTLVGKNLVWALPPLFLAWANLHGGVGLGLISVAAVVVSDALLQRRLSLQLIAAAAVSFVVTAATPMGMGLWQLLIEYSKRTKTVGISEWMAPEPPPEYLAFWAVTLLLIVAVVWRWRRLSIPGQRLVVISLVTLPLALSAHRNVAMFLLIAVPALSALLADPLRAPSAPPARDVRTGNAVVAATAFALAVAFVGWVWMQPPRRLGWHPISGEAINAVKACQQPMYNALGIGGILIYFVPEQPVFIDNRNDPYPVNLLEANLTVEQSGDYRALFADYGIRCAVVEPDSFSDVRLNADPDWQSTYRDQQFAVYVPRAAAPTEGRPLALR
jgi:hypothetical protein